MAVAQTIIYILLASLAAAAAASGSNNSILGCYESIISFGDSYSDPGNLLELKLLEQNELAESGYPPYGRNFFHRPTGRYCDGRLIVDFFAESLGLPLVQAYFDGADAERNGRSFDKGVNFAVAGATVLDGSFFEKRGITDLTTLVSLEAQMVLLKRVLATIPDSRKFLQRSLIVLGMIGANDYNYPLMRGKAGPRTIQSYGPTVVASMGSTIEELIKLGAETILVPGNTPIGCNPNYLTQFKNISTQKDYDFATGCLNWLNKLAIYHNELLQKELIRLQKLHPHVHIIYVDFYNAILRFYLSPLQFGFTGDSLRACCGAGGPYNYVDSQRCGHPGTTCCDDPSLFISWDGLHLTEEAYRIIAQDLLQGRYTNPPFKDICRPITKSSPAAQIYKY
ncbi:Sinapine esterase [Handroanthus impetiginosus]|uniref:Sinapine esterase n=1 Tax=Handroanthus impetiginosus TaxID=429701 RepID=A0A2G9I0P7_9LAMI|nr:Sinapine esterase [Handroanthus impetiginosus]